MAPTTTALTRQASSDSPSQLDSAQTLRASTALLRKIHSDDAAQKETGKSNLLADADEEEPSDETPVWLILTTKKHIVDKKRLKPSKIVLPHPYLDISQDCLRICLITADPQRKYKDLVAGAGFPLEVGKKITRVIGLEKIKSKYKSYEAKRQLKDEYDVFLADDRVVTYLPNLLGKVFYKGGSKRPVPISLEGKRQSVDDQGNKRKRLAEGGNKVVKDDVKPEDVAREITRTLGSALVHLAPSTTTAVKVGVASQTPEQVQENIDAVVEGLVDKFVPQKWKNVRSVHVKGPNTAALPIWLAEELWGDEQDVLEEAPKANEAKKRKRSALAETEVIEVPGPDGKMRKLERPSSKRKSLDADNEASAAAAKKQKSEFVDNEAAKKSDKAEKAARKEALKKQKESARSNGKSVAATPAKAKAGQKAKA